MEKIKRRGSDKGSVNRPEEVIQKMQIMEGRNTKGKKYMEGGKKKKRVKTLWKEIKECEKEMTNNTIKEEKNYKT